METQYAAFDSREAVDDAIARLQAFGFPRSSIRYAGDEEFRKPPASFRPNGGFLSSLEKLFTTMTGSSEDPALGLYEQTLRRGGSVLAVEAATPIEAQTAHELLRLAGAVDPLSYTEPSVLARSWHAPAEFAALPDAAGDRAAGVGGTAAFGPKLDAFEPGTLEWREQAEVITLTKVAHVVEELCVNKSVTVYTETLEDTVRGTAVEVEPLRSASSPGLGD